MSSATSAERSFRQRMLDAAFAAAHVILPIFPAMQTMGTFDGDGGQYDLTVQSLGSAIRDPMQLHVPVAQQYMVGTTRGVVFDVTSTMNPQANSHAANIGVTPAHLSGVPVATEFFVGTSSGINVAMTMNPQMNGAAVATNGVTPTPTAVATTGITPAPGSIQTTIISGAVISASDVISAEAGRS